MAVGGRVAARLLVVGGLEERPAPQMAAWRMFVALARVAFVASEEDALALPLDALQGVQRAKVFAIALRGGVPVGWRQA